MLITEVKDARSKREFLEIPGYIYADDPVWVRPLDSEIEAIFDPQKNNYHSHGTVTRWVLKDAQGKLIGRVAAFINEKKARLPAQPTGGMGFFECIDDPRAANLLFDTCREWLGARGMKAMDGPVNFGENDKHWGLLVWGFTHPSFGMSYNAPYYQALFEGYGFEKLYDQKTTHINITVPFTERFSKISDWVMKKPGYTFEYFDPKKADKYISDIQEIYNDAWQDFDSFSPISKETLYEQFHEMKPIMDTRLVWFAYINDEPAAFIICLPDVNQIIKKLNGKLGPLEKLRFLYYKWTGAMNRIRIIVLGVKQKFQKHGLESVLVKKLQDYTIPSKKYVEAELSWVGDFNTKMQALHVATGGDMGKKHTTYRYIFPD